MGETEQLPVRKSFAEGSLQYEVDPSQDINVTCPVVILHGVQDESVPYKANTDNSGIQNQTLSFTELNRDYEQAEDRQCGAGLLQTSGPSFFRSQQFSNPLLCSEEDDE